ncbi:MAG: sigma factor-like helix-turn-helix DNA-binding protein [Halanaerobiales bacterium]
MSDSRNESLREIKEEIEDWYEDFCARVDLPGGEDIFPEMEGLAEQEKYNLMEERLRVRVIKFFPHLFEEHLLQVVDYFRFFAGTMDYNSYSELPQALRDLCFYMFIFDCRLVRGLTPLGILAKKKKAELSGSEEEILASWRESALNVYEVQDKNEDKYWLDPLYGGKEVEVRQKRIETAPGALIVGRVARCGEEYHLPAPFDVLPPDYAGAFVEEIDRAFSEYKQETGVEDFSRFLRDWGIVLLYLSLQIKLRDREELQVDRLYEARYRIQSPRVARRRLLARKKVVTDDSSGENGDYESLIWLPEDEKRRFARANFILAEDKLIVRSHRDELLQQARAFLEEVLSFLIAFEEEGVVDLGGREFAGEEDPEQLVEKFLETPLNQDRFGELTPRDLIKSEKGRELVRYYIESMELVRFFSEDFNRVFTQDEIDMIREKLGFESSSVSILRDDVEELIAEANSYNKDISTDTIMIWRDYREKAEKIRGRDRSWAAAAEYLLHYLRDDGYTQKEVGEKYDVSSNTISQKYRKILQELATPGGRVNL